MFLNGILGRFITSSVIINFRFLGSIIWNDDILNVLLIQNYVPINETFKTSLLITIHQLSWWFFIFGRLSPLKPRRHYHVANVTRQRRFLLKRLLQLSTRSTGRLEIQLLIAFVLHLLSIDF